MLATGELLGPHWPSNAAVLAALTGPTPAATGEGKDHVEKIDFQGIFIAVVNWPISEFYRAFACIMR